MKQTGRQMLAYGTLKTPIGRLFVAAEERGIVAVTFLNDRPVADELPRLARAGHETGGQQNGAGGGRASAHLSKAMSQLRDYFAGTSKVFDLDLFSMGTDFQKKVWRALARIPYGETRSYAEIARSIDRPRATRAVGGAIGDNPAAVVVPCHRVIGVDGSLTGFGGGLDRKRWLLEHESGARRLPIAART